jgi:DtxR family transcriptional regulator, Mn-dependent transcriptional regulator
MFSCVETVKPYQGGMATSTVENYLKHLLLLGDEAGGMVSMGALASSLAVVPGTATTMVKALADDGLVDHKPRHGVRLTNEGRRVALNVLRKHRLVETFLVNVLKMDWAKVHVEAEQLEHAISDEVLDRLDALLGHPIADPHGDPIPSRQGKLDSQVYATLATCGVDKPLRIVRVTEQSTEFLQFAEQNGLRPGTNLRVVDRNLTAGLVTLRRPTGRSLALSLVAAGRILVEPQKG